MIFKILNGLAVTGVSIVGFASTASAAGPGAVKVVTQEGVKIIPPELVGIKTPPPVIVVNGIVKGFHEGGT